MQKTTETRPNLLHRLRLLIAFPIDLYAFTSIAFLLGWIVLGERLWFVNAWVNLMPAVFFPLILCVPIALLLRRRISIALLLPVVGLFLFLYGGRFLTETAYTIAAEPQAPTLTLLSHNLLGSNHAVELSEDLIREVDADIVLFQELNTVMVEHFEVALADVYPHQALHDDESNGILGRGLISRYPILSNEMVNHEFRSPLYQRVEVDYNGRIIVIYNIHMPLPRLLPFYSAHRGIAFDFVLENAAQESHPLIIMGDFNSSDQTADYRLMARELTDVYGQVGIGFGNTFPHTSISAKDFPLIRIDFAFTSHHWQAQSANVVQLPHRSDHYPLQVTVALDE